MDVADNILKANRIGHEALIDRIMHGTFAANLTKGEMNSTDKKLSSLEEPEFAWTFRYQKNDAEIGEGS